MNKLASAQVTKEAFRIPPAIRDGTRTIRQHINGVRLGKFNNGSPLKAQIAGVAGRIIPDLVRRRFAALGFSSRKPQLGLSNLFWLAPRPSLTKHDGGLFGGLVVHVRRLDGDLLVSLIRGLGVGTRRCQEK